MVKKIISGGRKGAELAALDVALFYYLPHGGWCVNGYLDVGCGRYQLKGDQIACGEQRTKWNVRDSDGTVVFSVKKDQPGELLEIADFAKNHGTPWLQISKACCNPTLKLRNFIEERGIKVLHVTGPQDSDSIEFYGWVWDILTKAFFDPLKSWEDDHRATQMSNKISGVDV